MYNLFLVLRQLEEQESRNKNEMDELLLRLSSLQEENRSLALDKANLSADLKRMEAELELKKQANRYFKKILFSLFDSILYMKFVTVGH